LPRLNIAVSSSPAHRLPRFHRARSCRFTPVETAAAGRRCRLTRSYRCPVAVSLTVCPVGNGGNLGRWPGPCAPFALPHPASEDGLRTALAWSTRQPTGLSCLGGRPSCPEKRNGQVDRAMAYCKDTMQPGPEIRRSAGGTGLSVGACLQPELRFRHFINP